MPPIHSVYKPKAGRAQLDKMSLLLDVLRKFLPSAAKYVALLLLLVNVRSFPLLWHYRVFARFLSCQFSHMGSMIWSYVIFESRAQRKRRSIAWVDDRTAVGVNPFEYEGKYQSWASPDESDFNFHLSNSSYAKTLDAARLEAGVDLFMQFYSLGGYMPLAGTHYTFLREIPILANYEVRTTVAAWDHKWIYIVCRFVSKPKKGSKRSKKMESKTPPPTYAPSIRTPASIEEVETAAPTPDPESAPMTATATEISKALTSSAYEEADGAVLHTISVSQMCFKIGRITIPPTLVFAINGLYHLKGHSLANPPPSWSEVKKIKDMRKFLTGGWRDVKNQTNGPTWWEEALGGEVEEMRRKNLAIIEGGKGMLEGVKDIVYKK